MNDEPRPQLGPVLRPAAASDQPVIRRMVRAAGINPMGLSWPHFLVAEEDGRIVGIGQIKVHGDGSRELASIAVIPERQGQGLAGRLIRALLANEPGPLYLTCRPWLETFYARFGFKRVTSPAGLPPYFRRLYRLMQFVALFGPRAPRGAIMRWAGPQPGAHTQGRPET